VPPFPGTEFTVIDFGGPMLNRGLKFFLISIAAAAVCVPLAAVAFVALALIGF